MTFRESIQNRLALANPIARFVAAALVGGLLGFGLATLVQLAVR